MCYRKAVELNPKFALAQSNLGWLMYTEGDQDGAVALFCKAIELDPKDASAHDRLGFVLRDRGTGGRGGLFPQGHRTRTQDARLHNNLAEAERMAAMQDKLPALQKGEFKPRTSDELHAMAGLCKIKKLFLASARMYAAAFADDPKLAEDLKTRNRYDAACWAALAAAGQGKDDPPPDETKKAELRRQALAWLRADLDLWTKHLQSDKPEDRKTAVQTLRHWQEDADLSGLRDAAGLAKLPADEQEACKKLWADVQALLDKADAKEEVKRRVPQAASLPMIQHDVIVRDRHASVLQFTKGADNVVRLHLTLLRAVIADDENAGVSALHFADQQIQRLKIVVIPRQQGSAIPNRLSQVQRSPAPDKPASAGVRTSCPACRSTCTSARAILSSSK